MNSPDAARKGLLRMDLSESRFPPSPKVIDAISSAATKVNVYPESSSLKARNAIASYNNVGPENVIVGNGSDEIIDLISRAFLRRGDNTLLFIPTFYQYEWSAKILGAQIVKIPSLIGNQYAVRPSEALNKVSASTRLIWICNPNNPTGNTVPHESIENILKSVDRKVAVAVDECYFEFSGQTSQNLLEKYENLIIVRSLSKSYCLAGLRIGYAICNAELTRKIWKFKQPFNVNLIAQKAAIAALEDMQYYKDVWRKISKERRYLIKKLREIEGLAILPSTTNFLLVNTQGRSKDPKTICANLKRRRISVLPGWSREFSGLSKYFMRVLVSTRGDNDKFLEAFRNVV